MGGPTTGTRLRAEKWWRKAGIGLRRDWISNPGVIEPNRGQPHFKETWTRFVEAGPLSLSCKYCSPPKATQTQRTLQDSSTTWRGNGRESQPAIRWPQHNQVFPSAGFQHQPLPWQLIIEMQLKPWRDFSNPMYIFITQTNTHWWKFAKLWFWFWVLF